MFVYLLFIFSIGSSTYIDVVTKCICEELLIENDCNFLNYCYWDENKCIDIEDCTIESPVDCPDDIKCAYLDGKCTKFTSCDKYIGDKSTCEAISIQCTSLDGNKCQNKVIPSCSEFDEENCNYSEGKEGECGFIDEKCQVLKQCSDIDLIKGEFQIMKCLLNIYSCKVSNSKCIQKKCSDLLDQSSCQYIHQYDPFDKPQAVQICKWQDAQCVDAMPNDLNESTCFIDTNYSYLWNPNSKTCQKCNGPPNPPPPPDNFELIMRVAIMIFVITQ